MDISVKGTVFLSGKKHHPGYYVELEIFTVTGRLLCSSG